MSEIWMRRLVFQAYCFVVGVVMGKIHPLTPDRVPLLYSLFVILLVGSLLGFVRARRSSFPVAVAVALFGMSCFFLGWGRYSASFLLNDPGHISNFTSASLKDRASVEGVIVTDPEVFAERVTFTLSPIRARRAGRDDEYQDISGGRVEVTVRRAAKEWYQELGRSDAYGWRIRINAPILSPPGPANPRGFSYREFLNDQDIYGVQTIAVAWGSPPPIEILDRGEGFFLTEWALSIKEKILAVYVRTIPYPQSTFLAGVTLGVRSTLENTQCIVPGHGALILDECRVAGVTHVLAVSGQHVTILSGVLLAILSSFRIPLRVQAPIIILVLLLFLIITGMPPSAMRATLMNSLTIFFLAMSRGTFQSSLMFGIAEAAVVVLFINPKNIVQPAFTLSFAAVLSLGLISWPLEKILCRLKGALFAYSAGCVALATLICTKPFYDAIDRAGLLGPIGLLAVGGAFWVRNRFPSDTVWPDLAYEKMPIFLRIFIVAQGAILIGMMFPLSSFYFGRMSLAGPYANLIAIPLTGVVVPLGLLAGLVGMIPGVGTFLALILNATNDCLVKLFFLITHASTVLFPFPFIENLTVNRLFLYYIAVAFFVWWEPLSRAGIDLYFKHYIHAAGSASGAIRKNLMGAAVVSGLILAAGSYKLWARTPEVSDGILQVTFLSTTFGNSAVVVSPTGKVYLIDGAMNNPQKHTDVGERIIAPYLLQHGYTTVDAVILSTPAPEHVEGLAAIVDGMRVKTIYDPVPIDDWKSFAALIRSDSEAAYRQFLEEIGDPALLKSRDAPYVRRIFKGYSDVVLSSVRRKIARLRSVEGVAIEKSQVGNRSFSLTVIGQSRRARQMGDQSAVLKLEYGSFSILFPGDIGQSGIREMIESAAGRRDFESDILLVPDHGQTAMARAEDLLSAVRPSIGVFQAGNFRVLYGRSRDAKPLVDGARDEYELNRTALQERLGSERVYETDSQKDGAVIVTSDGNRFRVETMLRKSK